MAYKVKSTKATTIVPAAVEEEEELDLDDLDTLEEDDDIEVELDGLDDEDEVTEVEEDEADEVEEVEEEIPETNSVKKPKVKKAAEADETHKESPIKDGFIPVDTSSLTPNEKTGMFNVSTDFVVKTYASTFGVDIKTATEIHNNYWIVLKSILAQPNMGQVSLTKYGTFRTKYVPSGKGINPKLSKKGDIHMQDIPAHMRLSFSTGNTLKEAVNKQVEYHLEEEKKAAATPKKVVRKK